MGSICRHGLQRSGCPYDHSDPPRTPTAERDRLAALLEETGLYLGALPEVAYRQAADRLIAAGVGFRAELLICIGQNHQVDCHHRDLDVKRLARALQRDVIGTYTERADAIAAAYREMQDE